MGDALPEQSRDNGADGKGLGRFSAKGSALRSLKEGPLFYVTNTAAGSIRK